MATRFAEFPTDWHQERYAEDLERELAGAEKRVAELETLGLGPEDIALRDALAGVEATKAQLRRFKPAPTKEPAPTKAKAK